MVTSALTRTDGPRVPGPVLLVVKDGWGVAPDDAANAIHLARQAGGPLHLDQFARQGLSTELTTHGTAVGLPDDKVQGNSEVGHNAMGAGRVIAQGATLVEQAFRTGGVFEGEVWGNLISQLRESRGALHLTGLLSDGNVHSHIDHLTAMVERAASEGLPEVYLHLLLDGRDVADGTSLEYLGQITALLERIETARPEYRYRVASGGGRMAVTMDRNESDWGIVERGWKSMVRGDAESFPSARAAVAELRGRGFTDQTLPAFVVGDGDQPTGLVKDGDGLVAFNFRGDRMLMLCRAFEDEAFDGFARPDRPDIFFAGMTLYDGDQKRPRRYLVPPPKIESTFAERLSLSGVRTFGVAETHKISHVGYFWNGNRSDPFKGQDIEHVPSTTDADSCHEDPAMAAAEVTERLIGLLTAREHGQPKYGFGIVNFANGDMVGHSGRIDPSVAAVRAVDEQIARLAPLVASLGGVILDASDHGNVEELFERVNGVPDRDRPKTSHTLNPVQLNVVMPPTMAGAIALTDVPDRGLNNLAATAAVLMGFEPPAEFSPSLVRWR